jgi:hypothetical protein
VVGSGFCECSALGERCYTRGIAAGYMPACDVPLLDLRPPRLARPPFAAISRCFLGSIPRKPRPEVAFSAIVTSLNV